MSEPPPPHCIMDDFEKEEKKITWKIHRFFRVIVVENNWSVRISTIYLLCTHTYYLLWYGFNQIKSKGEGGLILIMKIKKGKRDEEKKGYFIVNLSIFPKNL